MNNGRQNSKQKTKHGVTGTPLKTRGELRSYEMVSSQGRGYI